MERLPWPGGPGRSDPRSDPRAELRADCARCAGLCCVAPALTVSADFAIDKPPGRPCPHLGVDFRCGIHTDLRGRGFAGCATFDCLGAGQRTVQETFGGRDWRRSPELAESMFAVFGVLRRLHELLWYLAEALTLDAARPRHAELAAARDRIERLAHDGPAELLAVDVDAQRDQVGPLLAAVSALVRTPDQGGAELRGAEQHEADPNGRERHGVEQHGADPVGRQLRGAELRSADLVGRQLRGADLRGANLRGAYLIGADLRRADLRRADLIGADLRAARLAGADLSTALFLTQFQANAAHGDRDTHLPPTLRRPEHWTS